MERDVLGLALKGVIFSPRDAALKGRSSTELQLCRRADARRQGHSPAVTVRDIVETIAEVLP